MSVIQFITLLLIEISIGYVYYSGKLVKYIHPKYNVFVLAGLIITGVLLFMIFVLFFKSGKYSFRFDFSIILLFPVFLMISDKGDIQAAKLIDNKFKGTVNFKQFEQSKSAFGLRKKDLEKHSAVKKTDEEEYKQLNILQIYSLLNQVKNEKEIERLTYKIETTGQLYRQTGKDSIDLFGEEFMLIRLVMICCAADMQPLGIVIENKQKYDYKKFDDWLIIKGRLTFMANPKGPGYIGYLEDEHIEKTEPPETEWLYPDMSFYTQ